MRKQALSRTLLEKIRKSDQLFRAIIETAHDVIWIFDTGGNFVFVDNSSPTLFACQPSDMIGKHYELFVHADDCDFVRSVFSKILQGAHDSLEFRTISKIPRSAILSLNAIPLFEAERIAGVAAFGSDITHLRQIEAALHYERDRLKNILDVMEDAVFIVNEQYEFEYVNPALTAQFGEVRGRKCHEFFHDNPSACVWCRNPEVFSGKSLSWEWCFPKTGKTYLLLDMPILNAEGDLCKLEIFHDITKLKHAEKVLELERNNLTSILKSMQHGVYIVTPDYEVEYVNPVIESQFGAVDSRKCYAYLDGRQEVCPACNIGEVLAGKTLRQEWSLPSIGKTYDVIAAPMIKEDGSVSKLAVVTDITERKKALEDLKQSEEKLRYLSSRLLDLQDQERRRISRELHDELGQTLTVLKLRLRLLQGKLAGEQDELLQEFETSLQLVNNMMEDVRRLSRNLSPTILEELGLKAAIHWLISNFGRRSGVELTCEIDVLNAVLSDRACLSIYRMLQQALTNIEKHARASQVTVSFKHIGDHVILSVEDNGGGFIVENYLSREVGERGLGLAIMDERARMLGGSFEISSREEGGTRLVFRIPVEKEEGV